ncbi:chromate transporter [Salinigranum salinum]|uniref:chromate transporter n=1 Tax=Salinigranum salinum TaxID=1364937 RepID=UPI00195DFE41|nr:chromate transporter [Salinigranum salinum]
MGGPDRGSDTRPGDGLHGTDAPAVGEERTDVEPVGVQPDETVPFREAIRAWVAVAAASFGGPAGQIAVMHQQVVERRAWVDDDRFLNALNYTMLLPGPEAHQLAVYLGWLLHGTLGGVVAGTLFVLPGFVAMLLFGTIYVLFRSAPVVPALFFGLKAAVIAVVFLAVVRLGRRTLSNALLVAVAVAAFVAMYAYAVPFPAVVLGAGVVGWVGYRLRSTTPAAPAPPAAHTVDGEGVDDDRDADAADTTTGRTVRGASSTAGPGHAPGVTAGLARRPTWRGTARTAVVWTAVWLAPLVPLVVVFGLGSVLVTEAVFFAGVAAVSFGGAYAALAFVAFLGAFRNPGGLDPLVAGLLGATVAGWFTYLPSYLWIFVGAPYVEALRENEALSAALSAVTAAVVGVIANLGAWFGVQVLFAERLTWTGVGARVVLPVAATVDPAAVVIAVGAGVAIGYLGQSIPRTIGAAAFLGIGLQMGVG